MDPSIFFQHLLNGVTLGSLYAFIAVGLTIIYGITRIINFAHGRFYMLGAYITYIFLQIIGLHYFIALPLTILTLFIIGYLFDVIVLRKIRERGYVVTTVITLCVGLIIGNLVKAIWGRIDLMMHTFLTKSVTIGPITTYAQRLFSIPVILVTFWILHYFLFNTKTGNAMRAYSQNQELCIAVGVDTNRILTFSIALSASLAGLGAAVIAPLFRIFPDVGGLPINKAYVIICMGGFGNVKGALLCAFIIGITESVLAGYFFPSYRDLFGFALAIIVFLIRPQGIFGTKVGFEW